MKIDSIFEVFDRKIDESSFTLDSSVCLSDRNNSILRYAYKAYTRLLVDVSSNEDLVYTWGLVSSFYRMVKTLPVLRIQDLLDALYGYFMYHEETSWSLLHFKGAATFCGLEVSVSEKQLVWSIYNKIIANTIRQGMCALADLASICKFFAKLELDRPELEQDCITSYYQDEEWLAKKPKPAQILLNGMNGIMREWLRDFNPTFLPVRHGSGSVADCGPTKWDKYHHLGTDAKLRFGIEWLHGYNPVDYYPSRNTAPFQRTSKYITVPKSLKKRRGISMEPATLQYFQQGVMITLYDYITKRLPQIPLTRQVVNQDFARVGSIQGYFCTIDLSSASDLVDYQLVKSVFQGTNLLKYQICTRSDHTLMPDGNCVKLNKFAPMGSALCFPTESLIFASCCEFIRRSVSHGAGYREILYSTYGDDIIINNSLYDIVTEALIELGFRVNHEKSFHTGPFRESCGGDFYKGVCVTPLRYRLIQTGDKITPETYAAICSMVNNAAGRGYFKLRKYLLEKIVKSRPGPLFTDSFGKDPAIWSPTPTNFNNKVRWNKDYQRAEVRYQGTVALPDDSLQKAEQDQMLSPDDALYYERLIEREYFPNGISEFALDQHSLGGKFTGYRRLTHLL